MKATYYTLMSRISGLLLALFCVLTAGTLQAADIQPGDTFQECRNCPEMVVLPAGSFMMGSPESEVDRRDNEPLHEVTFAESFAIATTPVTWDMWEACVRDSRCDGVGVESALVVQLDGTEKPDWDWGRGTRPVVGVSWYDAQQFVGWLN